MAGPEYFKIECPEKAGGAAYREIAIDVLKDLNLTPLIKKIHIFIDPKFPLFLAVGRLRKIQGMIRIRDFANVMLQEDGVILDIGEETHLSDMLSLLWNMFGRDHVEQPDRFTVHIRKEGLDPAVIEDLIVTDPSKGAFKDLIYALQWIAPEGFKVRREYVSKDRFYYLASENTLPEDALKELVDKKFALLEEKK